MIAAGIGLVVISGSNLRSYKDFSLPETSSSNFAMTLSMLIIGIIATITNILFIFVFSRLLFWNSPRVKLTLCESCSEWPYVCS